MSKLRERIARVTTDGCAILVGIVLSAVSLTAHAAPPVPLDEGAAGLRLALARLQTTGSVLHVVAHPDDEDGPMLAYMARKEAAHTMLFSITRGEGGANLISSDFFDALGILRTLEHRQAARWYGNQLFYSRAVDYGYSKTLAEARRQWQDGEPVLRDLVRVVRRERPDVIVSRFRGDKRDGHGHHQMAGVVSRRAFEVAGDPNVFPEQIRAGLRPWQPRKLYIGNINPRWRSEDANYATIELDTGEYAPLLGRSYAQIARYGLGFQRSQGISGHEAPAGPSLTRYRRIRPDVGDAEAHENSFLQGINVSIAGLAEFFDDDQSSTVHNQLRKIGGSAQAAIAAFDALKIEGCIPHLLDGLQGTIELLEQLELVDGSKDEGNGHLEVAHRLRRKQRQFEVALARAFALDVTATAAAAGGSADSSPFAGSQTGFNHAVPGQSLVVHVRLVNRSSYELAPQQITVTAPDGWTVSDVAIESKPVKAREILSVQVPVEIPEDAEPTRPYWRRASIAEPFYRIIDESQAGRAMPEPPLVALVVVRVNGVPVRLEQPVQVALRHPDFGQVEYPLSVVPKLSVGFVNKYGIVSAADGTHAVRVRVRSAAKGPIDGQLRLDLPDEWTCEPKAANFRFSKEDEEGLFDFQLRAPDDVAAGGELTLRAVAISAGREFREGYHTVTARDLDRCNLYTDATQIVRVVDLVVPRGLRIGYVMGSGDEVPESLAALGLAPTMLDEQQLATGDLSRFDTVLIGVRAYAVREDVRTHNQRLLDYVYGGGTLIVQYQTPEFDHNFGPYPYRMGRRPEEVSEEDATVTLLAPDHPIFNRPNRITADDFAGWVEQRGSKFFTEWDKRYRPLLECHDTDQPPQSGGMLIAAYGQGTYIYSAYAWYRQLPHGVPGAYRIFANMISIGKQP